jgi:asparagine synthase (glutamine-hydrolysing)
VPASVLDRPKQGFHLPLDDWLNGSLKPQLDALVNDRQRPVFDYLDPDAVKGFAQEHAARRQNRVTELSFALILDAFLEHSHRKGQGQRSERSERSAA